jgi:rhodanese-related sulfurtransferase/DNA-binding transcriptional ArsR family regulator
MRRQPLEFKDALFEHFARIASGFSSPKRIEIIDLLTQGERPVEGIAREAGLSVANTSRHLQVLKAAGLVAARKAGLQVFYRLADPMVLRGYRALRELSAARQAEVRQLVHDYFSSTDGLEPVEKRELLRRVRARDVVVLDVRPPDEYAAGHIAGALSVPLAEIERHVRGLPRGKRVVAYCRGPYCFFAAEAVRLLRKRGVRAFRLKEGFPEWREAGFPVERGPAQQARQRRPRAITEKREKQP